MQQDPESKLARVKQNVLTMLDKKAPEQEIDAYITSEGVTVDQLRKYALEDEIGDRKRTAGASTVSAGEVGTAAPVTQAGTVQVASDRDQQYAAAASEYFAEGHSPEEMQAFSRQWGYQGFDPAQLDAAYETLRKGGKVQFATPHTGTENVTEEQAADGRRVAEQGKEPSFFAGVGEGLTNVANHAVDWIDGNPVADAINQFGADNFGTAPSLEAARTGQAEQQMRSPYAGTGAGQFVGEAAALTPLMALPGGALAQGAAGGALMSDADDVGGVAKDAVVGAVLSKIGDAAVNKVANRFSPRATPSMDPGLQTLYEAGVRTTPGQMARGSKNPLVRALSAFEDRANRQPFVGDAIDAGRRRSVEDLSRATIKRSLDPIGKDLPQNLTGRSAIKYAGDELGKAYDGVTSRIGKFEMDDQFVADLSTIEEHVAEMLPARSEQFKRIVQGVSRFFGDEGTTVDGETLKKIETRLTERIRRLTASTDADQHDLADALELARGALRDQAARAYPEAAQDLQNINKGWASLVQVERAALTGKGGAISPNSYSNAVRANDASTRHRGYARGEALNQDLADAASQFLPSEIPDSGTASRTGQSNLLGLASGLAYSVPYALAAAATRGSRIPPVGVQRAPNAIEEKLAKLLRYATVPARGAAIAAPGHIQGSGQ